MDWELVPCSIHMGVSKNNGTPWYPQIIHFNRVFHYKPSISNSPIFGNILLYIYIYISLSDLCIIKSCNMFFCSFDISRTSGLVSKRGL